MVNYICNTIIMRIPIVFWAEPKKKTLKISTEAQKAKQRHEST